MRSWCFPLLALVSVLGLAQSAKTPPRRALRTQPDVATPAAAEKRIALLIGNAAYAEGPLRNPVNDARAMKSALESAGFDVTLKENATKREMQDAIRAFGDRIHGGAVGLFYFAGHGVQVKGVNHLIPIGARIEREDEVPYEAVDLGLVLDKMESAGNRLNILVLDACRNNPFARSWRGAGDRGLAQVKAPTGTLIAYATAPGSTAADGEGTNGIYTEALLAQMRQPGLELERMFKRVRERVLEASQGRQTPWESNSTVGDFCFVPGQGSIEAPVTPAQATAVSSLPVQMTEVGERIAAYERGEKEHAFDIGMAFLEGRQGAPQNFTKAKEWFAKAAAHGDKDAYVELGERYQYGQGAKANRQEALKWFRKSAEAGDPKGMEKLGDLFHSGSGIKQDFAEAAKWYRLAAEKGERPEAAKRLGEMFYGGDGVTANMAEAVKWFTLADSYGNLPAAFYLGRIYEFGGTGVDANPAKAVAWMKRGAANGSTLSMFDLGKAFAEGKLIAADQIEAFKWLTVFVQKEANPTEGEELLRLVTGRLSPPQLERARQEAATLLEKYVTQQDRENKAFLESLPGR